MAGPGVGSLTEFIGEYPDPTEVGSLSEFTNLPPAPGEFSKGLKRGVYGLARDYSRAAEGALTGGLDFPAGKEFFNVLATRAADRASQPDIAARVSDPFAVDSVDTALDYAAGVFGEQAVRLPITALAGYLGGRAGARVNLSDQVLGTMVGASVGAGVPSFIENFGNIYDEQREIGVDDPTTAAKYALPISAIDSIGPGLFFGLLKEPGKAVTKKGVRQMFSKILAGTGLGVAEEAPTEALQEYLAVRARNEVDPSYDPNSEEAKRRVASAGIAGGLVGGALGGLGGGVRAVTDPVGTEQTGTRPTQQPAEEPIISTTPDATAEATETDEVINYRQIVGLPEIDTEPLPLVDPQIGAPVDDFTARLAEADEEFKASPQALTAKVLRSRIPEIEAELTLLERESKSTAKNKRPASEIAADREALQGQLTAVQERAAALETLAETPTYQPKSSLTQGTLLSVDQEQSRRVTESQRAFEEQVAAIKQSKGLVPTAEQATIIRRSSAAAQLAAPEPIVAPADRARVRIRFGPRSQEEVADAQEQVIKATVNDMVSNELLRPEVATSVSTIMNKGLQKARQLDPEKYDEAVAAFMKTAFRGKKIAKADQEAIVSRVQAQLRETTPKQDEVKPLRSTKPEWLAGVPEDAEQGVLFVEQDGEQAAIPALIQFDHYGNVPTGVTDPNQIGRGVRGADQALAQEVGISYTSAVVTGSEFNEKAVTQNNKYTGTLRSDKVRVARSDDPLFQQAKAEQEATGTFNDSLNWMEYAKKVRDAGYDAMLYANGQLRIFTPQRVAPTFNIAIAEKFSNTIPAQHKKAGGGTWNLVTGQEMGGTANYAVSPYKAREMVVEGNPTGQQIKEFIRTNQDLLANPGHYLGTWFNSEDGNTYIDVAILTPSFKEAQALAKRHKQIAFFNLRTFDEIPTEQPQPEQPELFRNTHQFNRQDAIYHAKADAAIGELERILGSPRGLEVKLYTGEGNAPAGVFTKGQLKDVISLAENATDVASVAAHEGFHFLEERVLPPADKEVIRRSFDRGSRMFKRLEEAATRYDLANGTSTVDDIRALPAEAHAYGYEYWKRGELEVEGALRRVFEWIKDFLERLSNIVQGYGFRTGKDIFAMIDRGTYARRETQALRVTDETGDSWINDIEPDAIPGLQKAGDKTRANLLASEAKGRPPQVNSPQAVASLRRMLRDLAIEGENGRTWHEDSSREIMAMYNNDKVKAEILAKLIAVFSPRTQVGGDIMFALQAIDQFNKGQPIRAGVFPQAMSKKAAEILDFNESDATVSGIKRNTFYRNLMLGIDPENFNSETQGATIDMWMAHAFGYENNVAGIVNLSQYRYAEAETGRLARELGWQIEETQAAIWVSVKTRWNMARNKVKAWAEKNGLLEDVTTISNGVSRVNRTISRDPEKISKFLRKWREFAMKEQPGPGDFGDALFNYGDAIRTLREAGFLENADIKLREVEDVLPGMEEDHVAYEGDEDLGDVSLKYYSKASLGDLITQAKRGEAQTTQLYSVIGDMIDKSNISEEVQKSVMGNTVKGFTRGTTSSFKTFYDQHISSGLNLARKSIGFKNVFNILTNYTQRKNRLIADSVDNKLSLWRAGSTSTNIENATRALLTRTVNGWELGSPQMQAELQKLSKTEREMFHQATNMIADRLRAEFEADKVTYAKLLGPDTQEYKNWYTNRTTHVDQLIKEGYFPERRYGDHGVHVFMEVNGKRLTLAYELDNNRGVAEKRVEQLKEVLKGFPELTVEYAFKHKAEHDGTTSFQQFLDIARREGVSLTQAEKERVAKALVASDSVRRNRIFRRKNVPGYSEDGMRILAEFAVTMSNKIAYSEFGSSIQDALAGKAVVAKFDGEGNPQIDSYEGTDTWSQDGGLAGFYRNLADDTADFVLAPRPGNKVSSALRGAATFQFLGGSLAAGGVQLTSLAMNTAPYLTQYTSYTDAVGKTLAGLKTAAGNSRVLTNIAKLQDQNEKVPAVDSVPGLRAALTRAAQDGTTLDTEIYQIMGLTRGKILAQSRTVQRALNVWMAPFRITEQWNRISTFIAAYNIGRQKNMSGDELYNFAQKAVYDTQFRYDEANRPAIARGPWGAMLFTFKTYPIFMLELMTHLGRENPKAAVIMMLSLVAMSGIEGMPFGEDIQDLIDTIAQRVFGSPFNTKRAMRNTLKDASEAVVGVDLSGWLMNGFANQITGLNFANRVGLGNLLPGSRLGAADADYKDVMTEILGPAGAVAQGYLSGLDQLSRGEINKAAKVALPLGLKNLIKGAEQWQTGWAQDLGGRNIVQVNSWEAFWQSLGFSSSALSSAYSTDRIDRAQAAYYKQATQQVMSDIIKAVKRGDEAAVSEAIGTVQAWNDRHPDMPMVVNGATIRRNIALSGLPLNQRNMLLLPRMLRGSSESMAQIYGLER